MSASGDRLVYARPAKEPNWYTMKLRVHPRLSMKAIEKPSHF